VPVPDGLLPDGLLPDVLTDGLPDGELLGVPMPPPVLSVPLEPGAGEPLPLEPGVPAAPLLGLGEAPLGTFWLPIPVPVPVLPVPGAVGDPVSVPRVPLSTGFALGLVSVPVPVPFPVSVPVPVGGVA